MGWKVKSNSEEVDIGTSIGIPAKARSRAPNFKGSKSSLPVVKMPSHQVEPDFTVNFT
jgi:hypothetical protein